MTSEKDSKSELNSKPSRRRLLTTGLLAGTSAAAFAVGQQFRVGGKPEDNPADSLSKVVNTSPYGETQPGVTVPSPRQQHVLISVYMLHMIDSAPAVLDALGQLAVEAQDGQGIAGIDPANLTVTVGIGPKVVRHFFGDDEPGSAELPDFASDNFTSSSHAEGDLIVQACSDDPTVIALLQNNIDALLRSAGKLSWQEQGFRGAVDRGIGRNLLGFHDGVSVPHTAEEENDLVWIQEPAKFKDSTIMVVRRMPIDVQEFTALSTKRQERIIGRKRDSGAPLSGGALMDDPNLHAKSTAGEFDIPLGAHVRRAHPLPSGAKGLMLRRSYSYFKSSEDQGLLFISFQSELRTFTATQHRMDELDDLMDMTRTTASGTFLVCPGQTETRSLGSFLRV